MPEQIAAVTVEGKVKMEDQVKDVATRSIVFKYNGNKKETDSGWECRKSVLEAKASNRL